MIRVVDNEREFMHMRARFFFEFSKIRKSWELKIFEGSISSQRKSEASDLEDKKRAK